jgi:hypothetical protein
MWIKIIIIKQCYILMFFSNTEKHIYSEYYNIILIFILSDNNHLHTFILSLVERFHSFVQVQNRMAKGLAPVIILITLLLLSYPSMSYEKF